MPDDRKVRESTTSGVLVVLYEPKSSAAKKFMELGGTLLKRITRG